MKIEKKIPIPKTQKQSKYKELAKKMMPGDSVLLYSPVQVTKLKNALSWVDKQATTRTIGNHIRLWCIKNDMTAGDGYGIK